MKRRRDITLQKALNSALVKNRIKNKSWNSEPTFLCDIIHLIIDFCLMLGFLNKSEPCDIPANMQSSQVHTLVQIIVFPNLFFSHAKAFNSTIESIK